jgi:hypothetical protein
MVKPKVHQPENPLFTNGENFHMNACVGDNGGPYNLFDYGRGFFEGGHAAVKSAQDHVGPVDLLVYPAAFAYRHGVELYLKHLVQLLNRILSNGDSFEKHHKMIDLWQHAVGLYAEVGTELLEASAVERAGVLIGYFDAFDPTGQVFRYPEDIKGNRHLAEHKLINVEVLRDQMAELREILEGWVYQAEDHRRWQLEQIAEHRLA